MGPIVEEFLNWLFGNLQEWITNSSHVFSAALESSFFLERGVYKITGILTEDTVDLAFSLVYGIELTLLILKLLWKGGKIHILEWDGDADVSPFHLLKGSGIALGAAAAFPVLYWILVKAVLYIGDLILIAFRVGMPEISVEVPDIFAFLDVIVEKGLFYLMAALAYSVMAGLIYWNLLKRGAEMLFFRLGVPFAALDLVNSDAGMWKNYMQILFQMAALSIVQMVSLTLGLIIITMGFDHSLLLGLAFESLALSAPKLMAKFFPPVGGGGGFSQKAYVVASVGRMFIGG